MKKILLFITTILTISVYGQQPTFEWAKSISGVLNGSTYDMVTDASGNIYSLGQFSGTFDFDPGAGIYNLTSNGSYDIFVSKLDANGDFLWAKSLGGTNTEYGQSIALDPSGNIYITGYFQGTVDFDPGGGISNLTSNGGYDIYVCKLNINGDLLWAKSLGGVSNDSSSSLVVDASGNLFITGGFAGTVDFDPGVGTTNVTSNGSYDIFVCKLDLNGSFVWVRTMGGSSSETGEGIALDQLGNLYITGWFQGTVDFDPGVGLANLTSLAPLIGAGNVFVLKLDSNGNYVFAKLFSGGSDGASFDILVGASGIFIAGRYKATVDFDPGAGTYYLTSNGDYDLFYSKLDLNGNFLWAKSVGGTDADYAYTFAMDASENIYTTGGFQGTIDFDPGAGVFNLVSNGSTDIFFSKLDSNGNFLWAKSTGGTNAEGGYSIITDVFGNIYISGTFQGTVDFDPSSGVNNLTSAGLEDVFMLKFSQCLEPLQPSSINGSISICNGATEIYSVTNDPNATSYTWTLPSGWSGTSTTNTITATAGASGGAITVVANNACGISSVQTLSVIIEDVTAPVADVTTLANVTSECSVISLTAPTATDNCAGTITGTHNATLPISTQGATLVTWTYNDGNGNTSTQTQNVVIDDVTSPVANIANLVNITSECSVTTLTAPTATDNCAGSITGTHNATLPISTPGTTVVTWTYDDGNGNTSTQTQNVVIADVTAPVANIANLVNITSECSVTSLTVPIATDNCSGTITGTHNATLPISTQGTTVVTWTYDDGNGNASTQTQNVVIDDVTAPVANIANLVNITSECSVTSLTAPIATDNCSGTITGTHNATLPISTQGTTVVTWTYDDGNGNTSTQTQNVVITPINNGVTQSGAVTLSADAAGYNYQWVDCNNGNQAINGATNQTFIATTNGSYAVEIDNGSCTVTSSCVVVNQVGIEENSSSNVLIYPNPTKGEITISGIDLNTTIEIYNSVGELLKSIIATESTTMVSISDYSLGVYYVKLKNSSTESIQKLVKH